MKQMRNFALCAAVMVPLSNVVLQAADGPAPSFVLRQGDDATLAAISRSDG
jgi:hypothetical protein